MIVLGIDPGTAALGWGVIDRTGGTLRMIDVGCFETSSTLGLPVRLLAIHRFLAELIARHNPDIVAVERLFFSRNAQTAFAVGQARGVVLLAAAEIGAYDPRGHAQRGEARRDRVRERGQGTGRPDGRRVPGSEFRATS